MSPWRSLGFGVLLCVCPVVGDAAETQRTIAHEILDIEAKALPVKPSHYALLDAIIAEAKLKLPPTDTMPTGSSDAARAAALQRLTMIDQILINRRFIYPGRQMKLVTYLSDGLTPRDLSKEEFQDSRDSFHNIRRMAMMDADPRKPFFAVDCDIASFIYLAIGETLHLPITLVEAPEHDFVRWTFPDGSHLNFETMDGGEMSDADLRQSYGIPNDIIKPSLMMTSLSHDDIVGYVIYLRGNYWSDYQRARADYRESVRLRPEATEARDALAWSYATCSTPSCRDADQAILLTKQNLAIWRQPLNLDTLACAYAAKGDFDQALHEAKEVLAFASGQYYEDDLENIRQRKLCSRGAKVQNTVSAVLPSEALRAVGNR